jgi:hypothetical protein
MGETDDLLNRVRKALTQLKNVEKKQMFRGITFMVNDKMCISTGKGELMCCINPDKYDETIQKDGFLTVIMKGRPYKGYGYVSSEGMKTKKDFDYRVRLFLKFNDKAKASRKKQDFMNSVAFCNNQYNIEMVVLQMQ